MQKTGILVFLLWLQSGRAALEKKFDSSLQVAQPSHSQGEWHENIHVHKNLYSKVYGLVITPKCNNSAISQVERDKPLVV